MSELPRQLGRYELLKRIARGGMGEIYLAKARGAAGFEKSCIIKKILPHLAEEEEFVTKFLDEGHIVVQLIHGNIVPVFDLGEEHGEYFLAMEYIAGRDLREILKRLQARGELLPVDLALYITSEVCKALHYAHRKVGEDGESLGIVHRDVSPSNVLISREGEAKVIDFGIARAAGRLAKTVSGRIQGKFCYMSPEQASGKALDARSDIFSLGVVLYEMLTGMRPFEGESDLASLDLVRHCDFDPPSTLNGAIPPEIDAILAKALAKDKEQRYASADQLQVDILQYLYSTGSSPTSGQVARFLGELFPEGLERAELRSAREVAADDARKKKGMSLDDALAAELDRLGGDAAEIDPLRTTAAGSADGARRREGTATASAPADVSPASQTPAGTPEIDVASPTDPVSTTAPAPRRPFKRLVALALVAGVLVGGGLGVWAYTRPTTGVVEVASEPEGAQIWIDGSMRLGARTPTSLSLEEGEHTITLKRPGFEDFTVSLPVEARQVRRVTADDARLIPLSPAKSKEVEIRVSPDDALITSNGTPAGRGVAYIQLQPGEIRALRATHPDCEVSVDYKLSYATAQKLVALGELVCPAAREPTPDAGPEAGSPEKPALAAAVARPSRYTLRSEPPGATVFVDGEKLGKAPVTLSARPDEVLEIRAELAGHQPARVKRRAGSLRGRALTLRLDEQARGCLNLRVVNPGVARILIDGKDLGERGWLLDHELAAGAHQVRLINEAAGKDDTLSVTVEPGTDACSTIVAWDEG